MKDFTGREMSIGDRAVYCKYNKTNASLNNAVITGFTDKMVRIEYERYGMRIATVYPEKVVIIK